MLAGGEVVTSPRMFTRVPVSLWSSLAPSPNVHAFSVTV